MHGKHQEKEKAVIDGLKVVEKQHMKFQIYVIGL